MGSEVLVLGAGIVGVSTAIHLRQRGHAVVLVDRAEPGAGTSFGNAGLIQGEGVMPRAFLQGLGALLRYAPNARIDMHYHPGALPALAPFLARYWWHSRPAAYARIVTDYATLIGKAVAEHAPLIAAAGAEALVETGGWYALFRTPEERGRAFSEARWLEETHAVAHRRLTREALLAEEPALTGPFVGALHWTDPWTVNDPGALVKAYADHFTALGGRIVRADALGLAPAPSGRGWRLAHADGAIATETAVVALGPWADDLTLRLGYRLPLAVKRGYHMHYRPDPEAPLRHWMLDAEGGYLMAPMRQGLRLTTGAEFARRDAPPSPVQLERAEGVARASFRMGARLDPAPWMGARPATPDMLPIIGPAPRHEGLWFAFGHAHHGLTLGPVTGRLIAEMVSGETPFVDPAPFAPTRFARA